MSYLYIDIETLPIQDADHAVRFVADAKAPGNMSKAETIAKWREDNAGDILGKTSFDGAFGQICVIGWQYGDGEPGALARDNEADLLRTFFQFVGTEVGERMPTIVGHNVIDFDLPFIRKRAMVHGIKLPRWFPRDLKPWSQDVFDTMKQWDARNFISLDKLADVFGIEGKTDGIDGSQVASMWAEGKREEVSAYCADDVRITRQVHQQMMRAL